MRRNPNEARVPKRSSRADYPSTPAGKGAVERDTPSAADISNPVGAEQVVPHIDLLLAETAESIDRLRQHHAAMEAVRAAIEAESTWLAGIFAAMERAPK